MINQSQVCRNPQFGYFTSLAAAFNFAESIFIAQFKSIIKCHNISNKKKMLRSLALKKTSGWMSTQSNTVKHFSISRLLQVKEVEFQSIREELEKADPRQVQIVDVRTQQEFENAAHKFKTSYNLPVQTLEYNMKLLKRNLPIYIVCQSGRRAKIASEMLVNNGFEDVYLIKGGFGEMNGTEETVKEDTKSSSKVWSMERTFVCP